MRTFANSLPILFGLLVGCGGGDDDGTGDSGDGTAPDADTSAVAEVPCAGATIAQTFTTSGLNAYSPEAATVSAGSIVEFMPAASHNVASNDGLFRVGFGGHKCFRFDEPGSYVFHCEAHPFSGTLTVQ